MSHTKSLSLRAVSDHESIIVFIAYLGSVLFVLHGFLASTGDATIGDWGIPISKSASQSYFFSSFYAWQYNGFGSPNLYLDLPFRLMTAVLANLGIAGGREIQLIAVGLLVLGGISFYFLAKSLGIGSFASASSGFVFMLTPIMFDWLIFGWIYYMLAYDLLPLFLVACMLFLRTRKIRYIVGGGLILSFALEQPDFIVVYLPIALVFILFQPENLATRLRMGIAYIAGATALSAATFAQFFDIVLTNSNSTIGYYVHKGSNIVHLVQYQNLASVINPLRLWGGTFNFQFESFFPRGLLIFSFLPILVGVLAIVWSRQRRVVLFSAVSYCTAILPWFIYHNWNKLVQLPLGFTLTVPSIFLASAGMGLSLLVAIAIRTLLDERGVQGVRKGRSIWVTPCLLGVLVIIVVATIPWWTGQTYGYMSPSLPGKETRLNLYSIPKDYRTWLLDANASKEYFVMYLPGGSNALIQNNSVFGGNYHGVNGAIFYQLNSLPFISNSTAQIASLLDNSTSQLAGEWGSLSIKYIVIYENVVAPYNQTALNSDLSRQVGLVRIYQSPDLLVFENQLAVPVVHSTSSSVPVQIIQQSPTDILVRTSSSRPFELVLNQVYNHAWVASVRGNGSVARVLYTAYNQSLNAWQVDATGPVEVDISYSYQVPFLISLIVAITVIVASVTFLIVRLLMDKVLSVRSRLSYWERSRQ